MELKTALGLALLQQMELDEARKRNPADPPLTNCTQRGVAARRLIDNYQIENQAFTEAQLTEAGRLRKLGAIMRVISVLAAQPDMSHHTDNAITRETRNKEAFVARDKVQDRPEKKSGPQPLRRRP